LRTYNLISKNILKNKQDSSLWQIYCKIHYFVLLFIFIFKILNINKDSINKYIQILWIVVWTEGNNWECFKYETLLKLKKWDFLNFLYMNLEQIVNFPIRISPYVHSIQIQNVIHFFLLYFMNIIYYDLRIKEDI